MLEESQDRLFVKEAKTAFLSGAVWHIQTCDTNKEEASIKQDRCGQAWYVGPLLEQFEIYHFHDTGDKSPMKDFAPLHDNVRLKRDGSNCSIFIFTETEISQALPANRENGGIGVSVFRLIRA